MSARQEAFSTIEISDNSEGFLFSETGFLKFTPDRRNLLAVSNDGAVYKYTYNPSEGLANITELASLTLPLNEKIAMISISNSCDLAFASEEHESVKLCKIDGEKYGEAKLVTKAPGKVLALAINPQGTILCCSGADNITKIINVKDPEFPVLGQIPSSHFVRSIAFSEDGKQLAFLQVDGMLRLYKLIENNPVPQLVQTLPGIKGDFNGKFQVAWKGEDRLGVLYGSKTLRIYHFITGKWEIRTEFTNASDILSFEFLSTELLLISCDDDKISLFSTTRNKILKSTDWYNLDKSSLSAANESFACIFEPSRGDLFTVKIHFDGKDLVVPVDQKEKRKSKLSKLNAKRIKSKYISDSADEEESDGSEKEEEDEENTENEMNENESEGGPDMEFDSEADDLDLSTRSNACNSVNEIENLETDVKRHPVIQPCCTEWRNLQRYLAHNSHGFITARSNLDMEGVFNYDIEFMDRSSNNPFRFEDKIAFTLASMSEKGAVFASNGTGSCLHYAAFKNSEDSWTIPMTLNTEPIIVGINNQCVYLVNDRGILNIYSLTGLLRSSVLCPGRPISLVCGDEEVFLFTEDRDGILCSRINPKNGGLLPGSQSSRVLLYCSKAEENELLWCGLSFSGVLGAFSTKGKFSILLSRDGCDRWTEILDTFNDKMERVWPVYFDVNTLSAVVCKATEKYPDPYPAPHVIDFNFKIPEIANDPSYEEVFRTNLILNEASSTSLTDREKKKMFASSDRNLLELAQLSIKTNRLARLSDLAHWATTEKTIELLIQLTKHHKLTAIVEEIEAIKTALFRRTSVTPAKVVSNTAAMSNQHNFPDSFNPDVTMVTMSPIANTWTTPRLPEVVAKESPSGILANLTPMKASGTTETTSSSPAELVSTPSATKNPFAKNENQNPKADSNASNEGNAMLDYISTMMKLNGGGDKKKKQNASNLSINVFP